MALTTSDAAYELRYAADCRRQSMIEDVAKALCDACYGEGAWATISRRPEGQGQVQGWMSQARAAVAVVERAEMEAKLEIVKHVIQSKIDAAEAAKVAAERAERKRKLVAALAAKQDAALVGMSEEQIQAEIAAL